jgi:hypothetical protein
VEKIEQIFIKNIYLGIMNVNRNNSEYVEMAGKLILVHIIIYLKRPERNIRIILSSK